MIEASSAGGAAVAVRDHVVRAFRERFGEAPPLLVRAPGRVNLIGEHTDYNDGFVLPIAIDRAVWIALRPRADRRVSLHSLDFGAEAGFALDDLAHRGEGWLEYVKGIAWGLREEGRPLAGWEGVMGGDVPRGAGLSSSAAVELAAARAFAAAGGLAWDPVAMALLGQRVEHQWIGVRCGIMDQMIVAAAPAGAALLIDCRTLELRPAPLPPGTAVVVMDTGTRRGLVGSAYNDRRAQCEEAARRFGVPALRDVDPAAFERGAGRLDPLVLRRARHVVTENARTLRAAEAMQAGDAALLGRLMDESHHSLRADFEVSSPELDAMAELARREPGCFGARMTGAGFGGCAVALTDADAAPRFVERVAAAYQERVGLTPALYACRASAGASVER